MYQRVFADQIKRFRTTRGLDRHEFAAALEKDYLTVAKWENGRAYPTDDELYDIADRFNTSPVQFGLPVRERLPEIPTPSIEEPKSTDTAAKEVPKIEEIPTEKADSSLVEILCKEPEEAPVSEEKKPEVPKVADEAEETEQTVGQDNSADETLEEIPAPTALSAKEIKAYEEKKERYEKYARLSSFKSIGVKIRRIFAYFVDLIVNFFICGSLAVAAGIVLVATAATERNIIAIIYIAVVCSVIAFAFFFLLRDWLFGGRSLGKRMFCLKIVDKRSGKKAFVWQRLWRNVLVIDGFDFILMLFTGRTIGDRLTGTLVVSSGKYRAPVLPKLDENGEPVYDIPERPRKNHSFITLLIALLLIASIVFVGFAFYKAYGILTNEQEKTEEYQFAVSYLVENSADEIAEEDVELVAFSTHINLAGEQYVTYSFYADGVFYTVCVYEIENGVWSICGDCTTVE